MKILDRSRSHFSVISLSRTRFQISLHTPLIPPTPGERASMSSLIRPAETGTRLGERLADQVVDGDALVMARSLAKMLISRRSNFSTSTRYFTDNATTQFKVGDEVKVRRTVTVEDVTTFAQLTGDTNPIHLDEHFAKKTELGQLVVHGVILNGYRDLITIKFLILLFDILRIKKENSPFPP